MFNITNDEPIQFWVFVSVLLTRLGYTAPQRKLPYALIYALAWCMYTLALILRPIVRWQPFLSPFKVALAGTHHYYSSQKAKQLLGYRPVVSLEDGIRVTVDSMRHMQFVDPASSASGKKTR